MATLWIREYSDVGRVSGVPDVPVAQEPGIDQTVTFSTATQSVAFDNTTRLVTITADAAFHYVVGDDPTADTGALRVPASTLVMIGVKGGQKISVIAAA